LSKFSNQEGKSQVRCSRSEEISPKGYSQSVNVLGKVCGNAQPLATEKNMIIKIHYQDFDIKAFQTAEYLCAALMNAGYKQSLISSISQKLSKAFIADKIVEAELYDAVHNTPVLCGFISSELLDDIHFDEVKV